MIRTRPFMMALILSSCLIGFSSQADSFKKSTLGLSEEAKSLLEEMDKAGAAWLKKEGLIGDIDGEPKTPELGNTKTRRPKSSSPVTIAEEESKKRKMAEETKAKREAEKERERKEIEEARKEEEKRKKATTSLRLAQLATKKGDHNKAAPIFKELAANGNQTAMYELGKLHEHGNGVKKSLKEAFDLYQKSADLDHIPSMFKVGKFYADGKGVEQSHIKASTWYYRPALRGHVEAQFQFAELYYFGRGVNKSLSLAEVWYEKASQNGHKPSKKKLAAVRKKLAKKNELSAAKAKAEQESKIAKRRANLKKISSRTRRLTCISEKTGKSSRWTMEKGGTLYLNGELVPNHMWKIQGTDVLVNAVFGVWTVNFLESEASIVVYGMKTLTQCF
jgi:TPR repeat protein